MTKINLDNVGTALDILSFAEDKMEKKRKKRKNKGMGSAKEIASNLVEVGLNTAIKAENAVRSAAKKAAGAAASAANAVANVEVGNGITVKTVLIVLAAGAVGYGIYKGTQYQTFKTQGKNTNFSQNSQPLFATETLKGWGI